MIELKGRTAVIPKDAFCIGIYADNKVETREFLLTEERLKTLTFKLDLVQNGVKDIADLNKEERENGVVLTWYIIREHLKREGIVTAQLRGYGFDDVVWHSDTMQFYIGSSINAPALYEGVLPTEFMQMEQRVTAVKNEAVTVQVDVSQKYENITLMDARVSENAITVDDNTKKAVLSAQNAKVSEISADDSESKATTAMKDLLAMMGEDICPLVGGIVPMKCIPATATQEIYVVAGETELTSLTAQRGDLAQLVQVVAGEPTITKTWQCLGEARIRDNWIVWGTSYAVSAGNANTASYAENASKINNKRIVSMTELQYQNAVKDGGTYYFVSPDEVTV